jgi:DNA topoisomerase VI subunit B
MAGAEHQQADQGFSKLKPEPGSEISTKFANVKSRISWTPERLELLREMWDRGDKTSVIAEALGCKVGALNAVRVRFKLKPRRNVPGRPKEPDEPAHKIERVAFTTSRLMEFCTEKELVAQTGHQSYEWPRVIAKELTDNGIDACEEAGVAPVIKVTITTGNAKSKRRAAKPTRVEFEDNGPGIPPRTIAGIIDYNVRVSSREAYISPTRGRQGNALKSILPMAYVLGGEGQGETWIEAQGVKHRIQFSVNQIKQEPIIGHTTTSSKVTTGTRITVFWPAKATVEYQNEYGRTREAEATFQTDAIKELLSEFIWVSPHLTLLFRADGKTILDHTATSPDWSKYRACDATSAHWYGLAEIERYAGAMIARDQEHQARRPRASREKTTVRDFITQFRGMKPTDKQKMVLRALGAAHMSLYRFFGSETKVNHQRMEKLLGLLQEHTRPVRPEILGVIGEEHLRQLLVNAGGEPASFKYIATPGVADGVPYMVEIALCPFKAWVDGGKERDRLLITGVNFSATLENPFNAFRGMEGLDEILTELRAGEYAPVIVCVHYVCPHIEYLDRGKSRIGL